MLRPSPNHGTQRLPNDDDDDDDLPNYALHHLKKCVYKCPNGCMLTEKLNRQILIFIDDVLNSKCFPLCNLKRI